MNINTKLPGPSKTEYIALGFVTLGLVLLANSKQLLGYYGLTASDQLVRSSATGATQRGLRSLDSLSATNSIVTFLIWAGVGVICFAIVESIAAGIHEFRLEAELSSDRYVHPATFTKSKFWHSVLLDVCTFVFSFLLLASSIFGFALFALPLALSYCRPLLFSTSGSNIVFFAIGLVIIYSSLLIIDACIRLMLHRRKLFSI